MDITVGGSSCSLFPFQTGILNVGFSGKRKIRGPAEKLLE